MRLFVSIIISWYILIGVALCVFGGFWGRWFTGLVGLTVTGCMLSAAVDYHARRR